MIWPRGVDPDLTTVAFAVGRVLGDCRPVGAPLPVTCAARPPMRRSRLAVQHKVTADVAGWACELIVWELIVPVEMLPAVGAVLSATSPAGG